MSGECDQTVVGRVSGRAIEDGLLHKGGSKLGGLRKGEKLN